MNYSALLPIHFAIFNLLACGKFNDVSVIDEKVAMGGYVRK
jgi:hypothetical protein